MGCTSTSAGNGMLRNDTLALPSIFPIQGTERLGKCCMLLVFSSLTMQDQVIIAFTMDNLSMHVCRFSLAMT